MKRGRPAFWNSDKVIHDIKILEKKLKRRPCKRDSSLLYSMSRKFFGSWNNAMKAAGYSIKELQYINSKIKITPNICYFVGLVITDGHIQITQKKNYKVMLFTSYKNEKDMIVSLIHHLFNYQPLVRPKKYGWNKRVNYEIQISSKSLVNYLTTKFDIPAGNKSNSIRVPKFFFNTSKTNLISFLRGIIDGDGGISENAFKVSISSGSLLFLQDLKNIFIKLNLNSGSARSAGGNTFEIGFYKKSEITKLYEILYPANFYYQRKKAALENLFNYQITVN